MATIASLIVNVEANTAKLVKDVDGIQSSLDKVGDLATKAGAAIAGAFAVGAIINAGKQFIDLAGHLEDLSAQTGASAQELQKLKYAADQNGGSLDGVSGAITKMNTLLAKGGDGTIDALKALGLNFNTIRQMDPATAFETIGDAIGGVEDPMARTKLAVELFGKAGAEQLPLFTGNLKDTASEAEKLGLVMSNETVAAGDKFGDSLSKLGTAGMSLIGNVLGPVMPLLQMLADLALVAAKAFGVVFGDAINLVVGIGRTAINWIVDMAGKVMDFAAKIPGVSSVVSGMQTALGGLKDGATWVHDKIAALNPKVDESTDAMKRARPPIMDVSDAHDAAAKAAADHAKEITKLADSLSGKGAIKAALDMVDALKQSVPVQKMTEAAQAQINKAMEAAIDVYKAQGLIAPQAMRDLYIETVKLVPAVNAWGDAMLKAGDAVKLTLPPTSQLANLLPDVKDGVGNLLGEMLKLDIVPPKVQKIEDGLDELAKSFAQLAQIGGASFSSLMRDIGSLISAMDAAEKQNQKWSGSAGIASAMFSDDATASQKWASAVASAATVAEGATAAWTSGANAATNAGAALHGAVNGAKAGAAFGPWGMAIGAAAGALVGFIAHLSAGRKEVEKFAASFDTAAAGTGFDELHAKLLTLGDAGEALWIKLTQGVGKSNPEQAKKVIDEINAALASQDAWMQRLPGVIEKYGLSWETAGQQAKQAHLDDIAKGLIQDFADLTRAGFDVTEVTAHMTDAVNDYVHQAMLTGTEIPAAMRPLLQKMIDMGVLTDAAGDKITDLGSLSFAETLTEGFKTVVEAINQLTKALTGDLGGALDALGKKKVTIPIGFEVDDPPAHHSSHDAETAATGGLVGMGKILHFAAGGVVNFKPVGTDTVPAMLTPGEVVLNAAQQRNVAGAVNGHVIQFAEMAKELRAMRQEQAAREAAFPTTLARAVRDEIQKVSRR